MAIAGVRGSQLSDCIPFIDMIVPIGCATSACNPYDTIDVLRNALWFSNG